MKAIPFIISRLALRDRAALARHFLALSPEDRRLRFGSALSDAALRGYMKTLSFIRDEFHAVRDAESRILGVVHIARGQGVPELGLSVVESMRGQGIANALFEHAAQRLRVLGDREVQMRYLAENAAMMHLAQQHGMQIEMAGADSIARLNLRPATPETVISDWWCSQQAAVVDSLRRNLRASRPRKVRR